MIFEKVKAIPRRVVFAEGEEERTIRAALAFQAAGYGRPILIGRQEVIEERIAALGISAAAGQLEVRNAKIAGDAARRYTEVLYKKLQRQGGLLRDCQRMVNQERNIFAALMVSQGDADALVTGLTRNYSITFDEVTRVIEPRSGVCVFGLTLVVARGRTVFLADTQINELPDSQQLADIAIQSAAKARQMGHEPRVALLSFSNFGQHAHGRAEHVREAVKLLDRRGVDFEYDGEMSVDMALDPELRQRLYPFCRLSGPANVLVMPALHAANIGYKLLQRMGGAQVIGPLLIGLEKPVQIVTMGATVSDLVTAGALAAHDSIGHR
jgi:malate dehydrogenase (oxaloacetate-decarboxylating)(NADP+)